MYEPPSVSPMLPSETVPGASPHTDPAAFTSNTKHPVSANCVEVLVSAANECVWCQRCVLFPSSPSVRRIHEDESQKKLKALETPVSLFVLKYMTAQVRLYKMCTH